MRNSTSPNLSPWLTSPLQVSSRGMGAQRPMINLYEISEEEKTHG